MRAGELFLRPGCELSQGAEYADTHAAPADGVCCVLGGGNQPTIAVLDVVQAMFHGNAVVCLKFHSAQVRPRQSAVLRSVGSGSAMLRSAIMPRAAWCPLPEAAPHMSKSQQERFTNVHQGTLGAVLCCAVSTRRPVWPGLNLWGPR